MGVVLRQVAADEGTFVVIAAFTDETDTAVTPATVAWSLSDGAGTIINGRTAVGMTPASSINIVLSGNDLKYSDGRVRVVTIEATYNSTLGSNLPLNDQATFYIEDLLLVS